MSRRRGIRLLLAAMLAIALPVLMGCAGKPELPAAETPEKTPDTTPQTPEETPEETKEPEPTRTDPAEEEPTVRVAIRLSSPSVTQAGYRLGSVTRDPAAKAYQQQLRAEQDEMIRRIEETLGRAIQVKQRLTLTTNVISANVREADMDVIRAMEGVVSVTEETRYELTDGAAPLPTRPGGFAVK